MDAKTATKQEILKLRQRTSMVFQSYNLFKHKTALENVMEPLVAAKGMKKSQAEPIARELIAKVGLLDKADRIPFQIVRRPAAADRHRPGYGCSIPS